MTILGQKGVILDFHDHPQYLLRSDYEGGGSSSFFDPSLRYWRGFLPSGPVGTTVQMDANLAEATLIAFVMGFAMLSGDTITEIALVPGVYFHPGVSPGSDADLISNAVLGGVTLYFQDNGTLRVERTLIGSGGELAFDVAVLYIVI